MKLLKNFLFAIINYDYKAIYKNNFLFYKNVIKNSEQKIQPKIVTKAFCTINVSNNCNLSCAYCYRNKRETSLLKYEDLEKTIQKVKFELFPNAKEYSFSL